MFTERPARQHPANDGHEDLATINDPSKSNMCDPNSPSASTSNNQNIPETFIYIKRFHPIQNREHEDGWRDQKETGRVSVDRRHPCFAVFETRLERFFRPVVVVCVDPWVRQPASVQEITEKSRKRGKPWKCGEWVERRPPRMKPIYSCRGCSWSRVNGGGWLRPLGPWAITSSLLGCVRLVVFRSNFGARCCVGVNY